MDDDEAADAAAWAKHWPQAHQLAERLTLLDARPASDDERVTWLVGLAIWRASRDVHSAPVRCPVSLPLWWLRGTPADLVEPPLPAPQPSGLHLDQYTSDRISASIPELRRAMRVLQRLALKAINATGQRTVAEPVDLDEALADPDAIHQWTLGEMLRDLVAYTTWEEVEAQPDDEESAAATPAGPARRMLRDVTAQLRAGNWEPTSHDIAIAGETSSAMWHVAERPPYNGDSLRTRLDRLASIAALLRLTLAAAATGEFELSEPLNHLLASVLATAEWGERLAGDYQQQHTPLSDPGTADRDFLADRPDLPDYLAQAELLFFWFADALTAVGSGTWDL